LGFLLIFPLYDKIVVLQANIAEKESIVAELNDLIQKIDQWRNQVSGKEANIEKLNLALPSEKAIPDFIVSARSLVESSGMVLNDITIQADKKVSVSGNKDAVAFNVILDIDGTYLAFKSLLSGLEKNVRVADVQSIDFKAASDLDASFLNFMINLKVYYK